VSVGWLVPQLPWGDAAAGSLSWDAPGAASQPAATFHSAQAHPQGASTMGAPVYAGTSSAQDTVTPGGAGQQELVQELATKRRKTVQEQPGQPLELVPTQSSAWFNTSRSLESPSSADPAAAAGITAGAGGSTGHHHRRDTSSRAGGGWGNGDGGGGDGGGGDVGLQGSRAGSAKLGRTTLNRALIPETARMGSEVMNGAKEVGCA
jgi:hypothetical protein